MADDRTADGVRIAQLLASELAAGGGALGPLAVTDADPDAEPTADGALAYRVVTAEASGGGGSEREDDPLAAVYVHPDRARVEFVAAPDAAARAAEEAGLRVRPTATRPPRTLVFVEDGAEVKRVLPAFAAAVEGGDGEE
ncbi:hypothetical protein [Candidatus Halobonum tyrrellensis]|uniref:DUF7993 domain-containing protein n=1 Tax=Candidatus Halobonum tyrrellensis G22 TaxID=1324957 RepID=V4HKD4_9EURY|nr:hypothetical protein [Candidatus Halobonum tyrrellensis]ESP88359.1 hypothetical protein K933_09557 [Candidatus Halobonum tyrrellensis G22]